MIKLLIALATAVTPNAFGDLNKIMSHKGVNVTYHKLVSYRVDLEDNQTVFTFKCFSDKSQHTADPKNGHITEINCFHQEAIMGLKDGLLDEVISKCTTFTGATKETK